MRQNITTEQHHLANMQQQQSINVSRVPMHALYVDTIEDGRRVIVDLHELGSADLIFINSGGMYVFLISFSIYF